MIITAISCSKRRTRISLWGCDNSMDATHRPTIAAIAESGISFRGALPRFFSKKDTHLLELYRYVALNPVRAKMVRHPRLWSWSSYRGTAGELTGPVWLSTEWILGQFWARRHEAQRRYRQFAAEGREGPRPWSTFKGRSISGRRPLLPRISPIVCSKRFHAATRRRSGRHCRRCFNTEAGRGG